jgi:hypothetical protein
MDEQRKWLSLDEVWSNMMDDPYYGIEPDLITPEQLLSRLKKSKLWTESSKEDLDHLGRYTWIGLFCPLCKKLGAWTFVESPWRLACKECKETFRIEDHIEIRDHDNSYFPFQEIENKCKEQDYKVPFPYDDSPQQRLLHIWHGFYGLPLYKKNMDGEYHRIESFGLDYINILKNQEIRTDCSYFQRDDFENFLLSHRLPLPYFWFPNYSVSTVQYVNHNCIESDYDSLKEMNRIENKRQEWMHAKAYTCSDMDKKESEIKKLSTRYQDIKSKLSANNDDQLDEKEKERVLCALVKRRQNEHNSIWNFTNHEAGYHMFEFSERTFMRRVEDGEAILEDKNIDEDIFEQKVDEWVSKLKAIHYQS